MSKELVGEISIFISYLFFSILPLLVKYISSYFSGLYISLFRFFIGLVLCLALSFMFSISLKINNKKYWILRGVFGSLGMVLYYMAIQLTSSGRATLLASTEPIFVALSGYLIFKEKIRTNNYLSIIICTIGVIFVVYDGSNYNIYGDILALLAGISGGIAIQFLKKTTEQNRTLIVYLSVCLFGLFFSLPAISGARLPDRNNLWILLLIGLLAFAGQMALTYGYKYVSANRGCIYSYLSIPITILLSYFFIGELLTTKFFIGIFLIITGLIVSRYG